MCERILDGDGFLRTFLGTERTAYAAGLADLHYKRPLILVHTVYRILGLIRYHLYKVLRADLDTLTAGHAFPVSDPADVHGADGPTERGHPSR